MSRDRDIGELCIAGDWACVHGDLPALSRIATELATLVGEPLHCKLIELGRLCLRHPQRAIAQWPRLRDRTFAPSAGPSP